MNSLYNALQPQQNGNIMTQFFSFMQSARGQNPQQIINSMLSSGKLTQEQYQQVQERANQLGSQFEGMKNTFGFK